MPVKILLLSCQSVNQTKIRQEIFVNADDLAQSRCTAEAGLSAGLKVSSPLLVCQRNAR